ncbi:MULTISPECIES: hypothetical protein [unclassified Devosia]|uniref:hypothetical protein n=1 Tax=unclassified Devosia TaxID=196773 RepID=UPI00086E1DD9|nr:MULTISPECIES: hypothetical protein [unclassified Devosia]MBN9362869.1 hypothetical protein [Devosia sp.]ODS88421.1 MAG: hypothetical protein ABS47_09865 [Devosia sp. SCN 66-27]OJX23604.1 MAG: hypothetical protein BGO83_01675 [Devosia sp. 66-14]
MKLKLTLAALLVVLPTAVLAASLPITGSYGTPAGCAAHAGTAGGSGEKVLLSADDARFEGNVCPYTSVSETGDKAYEVKIACESGHDEVVRGTLDVTESADGSKLTVALKDGAGPKGEFPPCDAAASASP